jgi:hypothetical protein
MEVMKRARLRAFVVRAHLDLQNEHSRMAQEPGHF